MTNPDSSTGFHAPRIAVLTVDAGMTLILKWQKGPLRPGGRGDAPVVQCRLKADALKRLAVRPLFRQTQANEAVIQTNSTLASFTVNWVRGDPQFRGGLSPDLCRS